jgi:hypothetical protein
MYQNEGQCALLTDQMLATGHTVFQLFQKGYEPEHCKWLLDLADPKRKVKRVLSLGCGVSGMEAHWHLARPELEFELVNISQEQLDRTLCQGRRVWANAETYHSDNGPFDMVVIAYLLGHVLVEMTLLSALGNLAPRGKLLIYDVFEGSKRFCRELFYDTPTFEQLEIFGTANGLRFREVMQGGVPLADFSKKYVPWIAVESKAGLFIFQKP